MNKKASSGFLIILLVIGVILLANQKDTITPATCGGFANAKCPAGMVCTYPNGADLGVCKVCAGENQHITTGTLANDGTCCEGLMAKAPDGFAGGAWCVKPEAQITFCPPTLTGNCATIYSPVCGNDGITYSNSCMACSSTSDAYYWREGEC